ncbi:MAG: hypothetical protein U0271_39375 [Polyangiaceae bacterium]
MEAESAMVLDGLAVGVDYLEAIVIFLLSVSHPYASWTRPGSSLRPPRIADSMRGVYAAAEASLAAIDGDMVVRNEHPVFSLESEHHLVFLFRVRTFGVAICFAREAPLGFARLAARRIVETLSHELPYPHDDVPVVMVPPVAGAPSTLLHPNLDFDAGDLAPDTVPPRSIVGDRVRAIVSHLEVVAPDPHIVRLRLALRTGLGLEALAHPDHLSSEALSLVETAAEDILGLDRGRLAEVGRS